METLSKLKEGTDEAIVKYGELAQEIIDMDPYSWAGYQHLGWYNFFLAAQGKSPRESIAKAFELAQKALSKDDSNAVTHVLLGNIYLRQREYEKAMAAGEHAVALQPNSALAHGLFGRILGYADRLDQSVYHLKKTLRLDPFPEHWVYTDLCRSYTIKGEYEKALVMITKAIHRVPDNIMALCGQAAIYVLLDRQEEAGSVIKKILEINPKLSLKIISTAPFKNKAHLELITDALRKAGLPD